MHLLAACSLLGATAFLPTPTRQHRTRTKSRAISEEEKRRRRRVESVPLYDAAETKRRYYSDYLTSRIKNRGDVRTVAATCDVGGGGEAEREARRSADDVADGLESYGWKILFDPARTFGYAEVEQAKEAWFAAAERQHARAALLGSAALLFAPLDASRIEPLTLFARCGCPNALQQFASGSPNALVEAPLALAFAVFAGNEVQRSLRGERRPETVPLASEPIARARALARSAELVQGRVAMVASAFTILALQPQQLLL